MILLRIEIILISIDFHLQIQRKFPRPQPACLSTKHLHLLKLLQTSDNWYEGNSNRQICKTNSATNCMSTFRVIVEYQRVLFELA